jgi:hypothetical protein
MQTWPMHRVQEPVFRTHVPAQLQDPESQTPSEQAEVQFGSSVHELSAQSTAPSQSLSAASEHASTVTAEMQVPLEQLCPAPQQVPFATAGCSQTPAWQMSAVQAFASSAQVWPAQLESPQSVRPSQSLSTPSQHWFSAAVTVAQEPALHHWPPPQQVPLGTGGWEHTPLWHSS